jgi:hypothetical protein
MKLNSRVELHNKLEVVKIEVLLLAAEAYNKATPNLDAQARID